MKNFLFRMVQRSAGVSAPNAPVPPKGFHWPVTTERVSGGPPASSRHAIEPQKLVRESHISGILPKADRQNGADQRDVAGDQDSRPVQSIEMHSPAGSTAQRPTVQMSPQGDGADSSSPGAPASELANAQPAVDVTNARRIQSPPLSPILVEAAEDINSTYGQESAALKSRVSSSGNFEQMMNAGRQTDSTASGQSTPAVAAMAKRKLANTAISADALLANSQDVQTALPAPADAQPASAVRPHIEPGQSITTIHDSSARNEIAEPAIEVKIGRVEIQFDPPPAPIPVVAPATRSSSGFADYAALRRYAVRPWPNNR